MKKNLIVTALISILSGQPVHATDISDIPLIVKNQAEPNLIFVLDDSGSMDSEILLSGHNQGWLWWSETTQGFTKATGGLYQDADNSVSTTGWREYKYLFPNGTDTGGRIAPYNYEVPPTAAYAYMRSHQYNQLYYNPFIEYKPWSPFYNGTAWYNFPDANPNAARSHPLFGSITHDLTQLTPDTTGTPYWTFRYYKGMLKPNGVMVAVNYEDIGTPYFTATYYLKDPNGTDAVGYDGQKLKKYEIRPTVTSYPSGRTYAAEIQNFANWFTYHRKRSLATMAVLGNVISSGEGYRAGQIKFNSMTDPVVMYSINTAVNPEVAGRFLSDIYSKVPGGGTPTHHVLHTAGKQFRRTDAAAPIQYACQQNAALLVTDGYGNPTSLIIGNFDADPANPYNKSQGVINPYVDDNPNTLADIAMYHYWKNLRPDLATGQVPTDPDYLKNPDLNKDPHMNTYAITMGVTGRKHTSGLDPFTTDADWKSLQDNGTADSLDDLWHATINGRGAMYAATSPQMIKDVIQDIVTKVKARNAAGAAMGISNQIPKSGDNSVFASSFVAGSWSGDLKAHAVDAVTGLIDTTKISWTKGSAQTQLDSSAVTPASRKIATLTGGLKKAFQANQLSSADQTALTTPSKTDLADVVQYLRGSRDLEANKPNGVYRPRASRLGDIVSAEPVFVGDPAANYTDNGYAAFKTQNTGRRRMIYQGANDGMLHAFDAHPTDGGDEEWAYIPGLVLKNLLGLTKAIGFLHKYYVNATPVVGDADLANTHNAGAVTPNWKTILVGGLGKGGRGFYALDVTVPTAATEDDVASKILWEIGPDPVDPAGPGSTSDAFGYSFGKPIIAKTKAAGWVVLVTSGYNNNDATIGGDGKGRLYVLNAKDGAVIKVITTGAGAMNDPSGLAQISAVANADGTVATVYGGDLLGNLWRFDLSGDTVSAWSVQLMAKLVNGSGEAQPITVAPEVGSVNSKRMVFVGTGQYLGDGDVPGSATATAQAKQVQSFYGLYDSAIEITPLRSSLLQRTLQAASGGNYTVTDTTEKVSDKSGWFMDLTLGQGERVMTDPQLGMGTLVFSTNLPSVVPCEPGGKGWLYALDYATGGVANDVNGPANWSVQPLSNAITYRPVLIQFAGGDRVEAGFQDSNGKTFAPLIPFKPGIATAKRVSWREIISED